MKIPNIYKLIILGQGSVGKTAIINRIVSNEFDQNPTCTMGVTHHEKLIEFQGSEGQMEKLSLILNDT